MIERIENAASGSTVAFFGGTQRTLVTDETVSYPKAARTHVETDDDH